ncbi:MAG TPA: ADP-ribosyl-[dinitrogen reductase] hydrolase [Rhodocyclaceae bacterium]
MNLTTASRAEAAYLGLAVGDALGATVEFQTPREISVGFARSGGLHREIVGGGWLKLKPGQVTDDTTMALALGEAILERSGAVEAAACARAFDQWMRAKPVDIGNTVRRNLIQFRRSGDPVAPESEHDAGNGAAMRALPVALATLGADEAAVRAASRTQAHVTHHNAVSDAACEFLCLAVQDAIQGANLRELYRYRIQPFVAAWPIYAWRGRRHENPSGYVVDTLRAVLQALMETDNPEDCLVNVVNRGGDADTTGAIAGMLAGALYGREALPRRWLAALDPHIRLACAGQARALLDVSPATALDPLRRQTAA